MTKPLTQTELQGIQMTNDEIDEAVAAMADRVNMTPAQLIAFAKRVVAAHNAPREPSVEGKE
jgi:hypothetical protein